MAKVDGPLLSLGGSGTIAGTMTYSKWKGRPYARRRVDPANPNSSEQQLTRNAFAWSSNVWKVAGALWRAPWTLYAKGQVLTDRNAFQGFATRSLRGETDLNEMVFSPGAKGGLPPVDITLTPSSGAINVAFTNPAAPTGWAIASAIAVAIPQQDPQSAILYNSVEAEDDSTMNDVDLTGLENGTEYEVGAWLKWTKADGSVAYSVSLNDQATPVA